MFILYIYNNSVYLWFMVLILLYLFSYFMNNIQGGNAYSKECRILIHVQSFCLVLSIVRVLHLNKL